MTKAPKTKVYRSRGEPGMRYRDGKQMIFRTRASHILLFKRAARKVAEGNLSAWAESVLLREARKVVG